MNTLRTRRWSKRCLAASVLSAAVSPAFAVNGTMQPASPLALQQVQPALGDKVVPVDPNAATPKKVPPFGLKTAPALSVQPAPGLPRAAPVATGPAASGNRAAASTKKLFDMDDRAIIIVGGKQTTAGEIKRRIKAEIATKAGPPKTVKGGARRLDLAALNVVGNSAARTRTLAPKLLAPSAMSARSQTTNVARPDPSMRVTPVFKPGTTLARNLKDVLCGDNGAPKIIEVVGRLTPGGKFSVNGGCFGERPGRVELIGQFPGGKLSVPFIGWDASNVDLEMPANIRGASDHTVAVTVVAAEGRTTPAMQANFVAARERIEVPDRLWSPTAAFEFADTAEVFNDGNGIRERTNPAAYGQTTKSLRINSQCALDDMQATVLSGGITQIRGWETGPANEGTATMDWVGACIKTTTTTGRFLTWDEVSITTACRVAFQVHAWAYCPAGVSP